MRCRDVPGRVMRLLGRVTRSVGRILPAARDNVPESGTPSPIGNAFEFLGVRYGVGKVTTIPTTTVLGAFAVSCGLLPVSLVKRSLQESLPNFANGVVGASATASDGCSAVAAGCTTLGNTYVHALPASVDRRRRAATCCAAHRAPLRHRARWLVAGTVPKFGWCQPQLATGDLFSRLR